MYSDCKWQQPANTNNKRCNTGTAKPAARLGRKTKGLMIRQPGHTPTLTRQGERHGI